MIETVDIIIPAYNAQNLIDRLLSSINIQTSREHIKVSIVNDGDGDYKENISRYPDLNIQELSYGENKGCGYARQYGIDNTNGDVIVFADSDDFFTDCLSIHKMMNPFQKNDDVQVVYSKFYEKQKRSLNIIDNNTFLWLHGGAFKREFIKKNDIRFFPNSAGEDCGFNKQVKLLADLKKEVSFIDDITYMWSDSNNDNRLNTNEFALFTSNKGLIDNLDYVYQKMFKRTDIDMNKFLYEMSVDFCQFYVKYNFLSFGETQEHLDDFILWLKPLYQKYYKKLGFNEGTIEYLIFEVEKKFYEKIIYQGRKIQFNDFLKKLS